MFHGAVAFIFICCISLSVANVGHDYYDGQVSDGLYSFHDEFLSPKDSSLSREVGDETESATASSDYIRDEVLQIASRQLKPTPKNPKLSPRDKQWLDSHNKRRKKYHSKYKQKYVPLKWSDSLKRDAEKWARTLVQKCGGRGILAHDPKNKYGENLASGYGKELPSTENVLMRWVEKEENDNYPENGHFTQVLWRATEYVGCSDQTALYKTNKRVSKTGKQTKGGKKGETESGGSSIMCQIQVCRYARPGNCNMGKYNGFKTPMLADTSPCGPECPPGDASLRHRSSDADILLDF
eukprot:CCRYP_009565-RA/>CCRYP_009565-RA protein AED:0.40 eAED:0.43 QI:226/0.66/0.75/1/0.66/0.75/4/0/295